MHILRSASFSRCGSYRYSLTRKWEAGTGRCVFIGLNPSTANGSVDDPTIRRCMGFTQTWGFNELVMINLFAYKTPHPELLKQANDPEGPNNRRVVRKHCLCAQRIVLAWGVHGTFNNQAKRFSKLFVNQDVHCFGITKSGQPLHPLYQRADAQLVPYTEFESDH